MRPAWQVRRSTSSGTASMLTSAPPFVMRHSGFLHVGFFLAFIMGDEHTLLSQQSDEGLGSRLQ